MAGNEIRHRANVVRDYGNTPLVVANDARLSQVLVNLLVNAGQAIPPGRANDNEIRIRTSTDACGRAVIEVTDTGAGIESEILKKLFVPFFTTKPAGVGTGLGLAICQRIVHDLGGEIAVTSVVGQGSTFRVALPAAPAPEAPAVTSSVATRSARRAKILVVDDDAVVATTIRRVLSKHHDVVSANSGEEAARKIADGETFDLILCDLMMPVVTGMELHARLRTTAPAQAERMLFMTGGAFTPEARSFLAALTRPSLDKPFDSKQLIALVNERLQG
jgi:CheY-like chemotaxis protein